MTSEEGTAGQGSVLLLGHFAPLSDQRQGGHRVHYPPGLTVVNEG
jgi:hypothetical protein